MGMAYDATHGQVVLFGGFGTGYLGDTWTWDGTDWTQRTSAHAPSPREAMSMAYDAAHGQVVLFGGFNTRALGDLLYTRYIFAFQVAGLILLVAMIGAIVLTLRQRVGVRRQSIPQQLARTRAEAVALVKVPLGGGAATGQTRGVSGPGAGE
jgi:hypothetical protein